MVSSLKEKEHMACGVLQGMKNQLRYMADPPPVRAVRHRPYAISSEFTSADTIPIPGSLPRETSIV
jgi:hypothetical protein